MKRIALLSFLLLALIAAAPIGEKAFMENTEARLKNLDRARLEAETIFELSNEMQRLVLERIRLTGSGGETEKKFWGCDFLIARRRRDGESTSPN